MNKYWPAFALLLMSIVLTGCATTEPYPYSLNQKVWSLQEAPNLSDVIKTPITDVIPTAKKLSKQYFLASTKEKFETDEAFKLRQLESGKKGLEKLFFVKKLDTYKCTNYDFKKNVYDISCKGFSATDEIAFETKETGKTTLANAYTSREVVLNESDFYYLSAYANARTILSISSEEAKAIDKDIMIGIVVSIDAVKRDFSGCNQADLTFGNEICKSVGFKLGSVSYRNTYTLIPKAISDVVIYLKSNNKVLAHTTYTYISSK